MKGKKANLILKIDLEKASDKIEWSFIRETLIYFRFPRNIINLIMSCVTTSKISILINGNKTEYFEPSRGIRQGDPLSPYLFILCMEILSRKIDQEVQLKNWSPIKISHKGPLISHLFFANDLVLMSRAIKPTVSVF